MHPEIQDKVYAEINVEMDSAELTYDALTNFVYLEAVVRETLRVLPIVPLVARTCAEDMSLGEKFLYELCVDDLLFVLQTATQFLKALVL